MSENLQRLPFTYHIQAFKEASRKCEANINQYFQEPICAVGSWLNCILNALIYWLMSFTSQNKPSYDKPSSTFTIIFKSKFQYFQNAVIQWPNFILIFHHLLANIDFYQGSWKISTRKRIPFYASWLNCRV